MPNPTTRDRELANRALDNSPLTLSQEHHLILRDQVEAVVGEARKEGREEGLGEAMNKVPTTWLDPLLTGKEKVFDRKQSPEINAQNVLQGVRSRIALLLHQPAPPGAKE